VFAAHNVTALYTYGSCPALAEHAGHLFNHVVEIVQCFVAVPAAAWPTGQHRQAVDAARRTYRLCMDPWNGAVIQPSHRDALAAARTCARSSPTMLLASQALSLDPWTGSGGGLGVNGIDLVGLKVWLSCWSPVQPAPVLFVGWVEGVALCGFRGLWRPGQVVNTAFQSMSQASALGQWVGRCSMGRRCGRARRAGTLIRCARRVAPRATA
jgi:hypothetical protein